MTSDPVGIYPVEGDRLRDECVQVSLHRRMSDQPSSPSGSSDMIVDTAPLTWTDEERGASYTYHKDPLWFACPFILAQEMCERLAYYGFSPTLKDFLKHTLVMTDSQAGAYLGAFQGTMFCTPILSAVVSDTFLGTFRTVLYFSTSYLAGLALLLVASIDTLSEKWMVHLGLLVLVTIGAGGIKSCVNVFGAQQFHPVLQKDSITAFYTLFYGAINVGSLFGGISVPQVAYSVSFFAAYLIPFASLCFATVIFFCGRSRYVRIVPQGSPVVSFFKVVAAAAYHRSFTAIKASHGGRFDDALVDASRALVKVQPLCALQVPLVIAYNQMTTAYLTQGEKMHNVFFGVRFAPALMQTINTVPVIVTCIAVQKLFYPWLRKIHRMPNVLSRFLIGNVLGACSVIWACVLELQIQNGPLDTISIFWQVPQFALIGIAEIFTFCTGYEVSFTYAPDQLKTVSSGCNLLYFAVGGYMSGALYLMCSSWMPNFDRSNPVTYKEARYTYYFVVLAAIFVLGALGCLLMRPYFRRMCTVHPSQDEQVGTEATELQTAARFLSRASGAASYSAGGDHSPTTPRTTPLSEAL